MLKKWKKLISVSLRKRLKGTNCNLGNSNDHLPGGPVQSKRSVNRKTRLILKLKKCICKKFVTNFRRRLPGGPSMKPVGNDPPSMVVVKPRSPLSPLVGKKILLIV